MVCPEVEAAGAATVFVWTVDEGVVRVAAGGILACVLHFGHAMTTPDRLPGAWKRVEQCGQRMAVISVSNAPVQGVHPQMSRTIRDLNRWIIIGQATGT